MTSSAAHWSTSGPAVSRSTSGASWCHYHTCSCPRSRRTVTVYRFMVKAKKTMIGYRKFWNSSPKLSLLKKKKNTSTPLREKVNRVNFQSFWIVCRLDRLAPATAWGIGSDPLGFSWITSVSLQILTQNLAYLSVHQFYATMQFWDDFVKQNLSYFDFSDPMSWHFWS